MIGLRAGERQGPESMPMPYAKPVLVHPPEPAAPDPVDVTIAIVTRNRCSELLVALRSACAQVGCTIEVVMVDDASTDGTVERVRSELPQVAIYRCEARSGFARQRNFLAAVARGVYVLSIDDDAELTEPTAAARILADFEALPEIGVVAVPHRELTEGGAATWLQCPTSAGVEITDRFVGTAYAVRRALFLELGGFWPYDHGEERDFGLRMLQAGSLIRLGTAGVIEHRPAPLRDVSRKSFNARRSDVVFAFRNVPTRALPWHLVRTSANFVRAAVTIFHGRFALDHLRGFLRGFWDGPGTPRAPVDMPVYELSLRLRRQGPLPIEQVRAALSGPGGTARVTQTRASPPAEAD